jgi:hypothetical protein
VRTGGFHGKRLSQVFQRNTIEKISAAIRKIKLGADVKTVGLTCGSAHKQKEKDVAAAPPCPLRFSDIANR